MASASLDLKMVVSVDLFSSNQHGRGLESRFQCLVGEK